MNTAWKVIIGITAAILAALVLFAIWANVSPTGRAVWNTWRYGVQKADNDTRFENRKAVEDTCRAQMVIYNAKKAVWEQYKDSDDPQERGWANDAKTMANSAAAVYNDQLTRNAYTKEMLPPDLPLSLPLIF